MDQPEAMKLQRGHQNGSNHKVNTNVRIDFESNRGGIFKICNIAYKLLLLCKNEPCSTNKQAKQNTKITSKKNTTNFFASLSLIFKQRCSR